MLKSKHVSQEDLRELLDGEDDSEKARSIGQHINECELCCAALDAMAAKSLIWKKTPELLKDNSLTDSTSKDFDTNEKTKSFVRGDHPEADPSNQNAEWKYPITELLEPPKHPEMMGSIGKYDVEREIGRGGMGVVLKAHDAELNRPLAIKILAPHLASHGTARKRFAQEAIAAAGVLHPNVIAVHGVNNKGKTPYIVMPYVSGPSLQALVDNQGPLTEIEIIRIAKQIASGLAAAHSQGLVHRDIKPANILIEADVNRVLITDFGLARAEDDASMTRTGWLTGTPNYMSPEQTRGERPDKRSDLFSLGSLMYFVATGRLPFRADSPLGVLSRIQKDDPTPVRQVNSEISKTLADLINLLLQKDPDKRIQSAAELHELLEQYLAYLHQPDISKPPRIPSYENAGRMSGLAKFVGGSMAIVAAGCLALGYFGVIPWPPSNPDKDETSFVRPMDNLGPPVTAPSGENFVSTAKGKPEPNPSNLTEPKRKPWSKSTFDRDGNFSYQQGINLLTQKEYESAIEAFKIAAKSPWHAVNSNYNIGCCWALMGEKKKAFAALNVAVENGYDDSNHLQNDSDLASLREDHEFANIVSRIETLQSANKLVGNAIRVAREKQYKESESLCRKALDLVPNLGSAALNLGYALHQQGRINESIEWHQLAAESQEYAALGNYNLSCVYAIQDKPDAAFEFLNKAIEAGLAYELEETFVDKDSDLDSLRTDPRFAVALNAIKAQQPIDKKLTGRFFHGQNSVMFSSGNSAAIPESLYGDEPVTGTWEGRLFNQSLDLTILRGAGDTDWKWGFSSRFIPADFNPEVNKSTTDFELTRKTGTIKFTGGFSQVVGEGSFKFVASQDYQKLLKEKGIKNAPDGLLFRMFFSNEDEDKTIANCLALQKLELDAKSLHALMIDGVEAKLVRSYQNDNLSVEEHLAFLIWRVPSRLIIDYAAEGFDVHEQVGFINRRVPPKLLSRYNTAGLDLKQHDKFISWRVEPTLLKQYIDAGFPVEDHETFINHRVPPQLLSEYLAAGLDLDANQEFINGRVPSKLLKSYKAAGLDLHENESFIQSRVEPRLLQEYKHAELPPNEYRQFIQSRIPASLIAKYMKAGFDLDKHEMFLQSRVDPGMLQGYVNDGLSLKEFESFVKSHVPHEWVKNYQDAGLAPQKYARFIQSRVPIEWIRKYESSEFNPFKYEKFLQSRIDPRLLQKFKDAGLNPLEHSKAIFRGRGPEDIKTDR